MCRHRRHSEAFSDFVAAEMTAKWLTTKWQSAPHDKVRAALKNIGQGICDSKNFKANTHPDRHPATQIRMERIFLAHPVIRERANCNFKKPPVYCGSTAAAAGIDPAVESHK